MKSVIILLVLCQVIFSIKCEVEIGEHYDLSNDEDHVFVVKFMLEKMHLLFTQTGAIYKEINLFNKRFDALDERLEAVEQEVQNQADLMRTNLENASQMNERLNDLLNSSAKEYATFEMIDDNNKALNKELNQTFQNIHQQFTKLGTAHQVFQTEIANAVNEQNVTLRKLMNETLEHQKRQRINENDWTTIMLRKDGSLNFNRNWADYKKGFGDRYGVGEFFIGLDTLHEMTSNGLQHELLIVLEDSDNKNSYAKYDNIVVGNEQEQYEIKQLGEYSGNSGDTLKFHRHEKFTTMDRDNDKAAGENCAQVNKGAWWFYKCSPSCNLFGQYMTTLIRTRMRWDFNIDIKLKAVEMKIRQKI